MWISAHFRDKYHEKRGIVALLSAAIRHPCGTISRLVTPNFTGFCYSQLVSTHTQHISAETIGPHTGMRAAEEGNRHLFPSAGVD